MQIFYALDPKTGLWHYSNEFCSLSAVDAALPALNKLHKLPEGTGFMSVELSFPHRTGIDFMAVLQNHNHNVYMAGLSSVKVPKQLPLIQASASGKSKVPAPIPTISADKARYFREELEAQQAKQERWELVLKQAEEAQKAPDAGNPLDTPNLHAQSMYASRANTELAQIKTRIAYVEAELQEYEFRVAKAVGVEVAPEKEDPSTTNTPTAPTPAPKEVVKKLGVTVSPSGATGFKPATSVSSPTTGNSKPAKK